MADLTRIQTNQSLPTPASTSLGHACLSSAEKAYLVNSTVAEITNVSFEPANQMVEHVTPTAMVNSAYCLLYRGGG